jgi:hypothetical protein
MPQQKINFKGALLDPHMPDCLRGRMHRAEWNRFVREINLAIHDAQVSMCPTPYILMVFSSISVGLIMLDMMFNGIFGSPQIGSLTVTVFVILGVIGICYVSMCRPTRTLEECVELICEYYSDEQREIYFFYRHHAQTRITDNRFYIEVFVAEAEQPPPPQPRNIPEERGVLVAIEEEEERQLVLLDTPSSRALVIPAPAPAPIPYPRALLPAPSPYSQALVVPAPAPAPIPYPQALLPAPAPIHYSQALVPTLAPAPAPMPLDSQAMVPAQGRAPMSFDSQALVPAQGRGPMPLDSQAVVPAQGPASKPYDSQAMVEARAPSPMPAPRDSMVPISSVFGSIAPPPTHEDMAQSFESNSGENTGATVTAPMPPDSQAMVATPGPAPFPPLAPAPFDSQVMMAAPAPTPTTPESIVPISLVFGSIAPPPTHEDMMQSFESGSGENHHGAETAPLPFESHAMVAALAPIPTPPESIVPISSVFGSIAPPPTHEDMAQSFEREGLLRAGDNNQAAEQFEDED